MTNIVKKPAAIRRLEKSLVRMEKRKTNPMRKALISLRVAQAMPVAVRSVLTKAVAAGKLTVLECAGIETKLNKRAKNPLLKLDPKVDRIIAKLMDEDRHGRLKV